MQGTPKMETQGSDTTPKGRAEKLDIGRQEVAAESEHWIVRGNGKTKEVSREKVSHAKETKSLLNSSYVWTNIFHGTSPGPVA